MWFVLEEMYLVHMIRAVVSLLFSSCCYQSHVPDSTDGDGQQGCNWMQKTPSKPLWILHYLWQLTEADNEVQKKIARINADEWLLLNLLLIVCKNILCHDLKKLNVSWPTEQIPTHLRLIIIFNKWLWLATILNAIELEHELKWYEYNTQNNWLFTYFSLLLNNYKLCYTVI